MVLQCDLKVFTGCAVSGAPRRCRPRSATTCVLPGSLTKSYKVIFRWLLIVLGLEVPRRGQPANQGQLPLVLGLGPLSKRHGAC